MATIKQYRLALRARYGAYNYRIRANRGIDIKTINGWIFFGWMHDFEVEYRLGFTK